MFGKAIKTGRWAVGLALALLVTACAETPATPPVVTPPPPVTPTPSPTPTPPVIPAVNPVPADKRLDTLPGWGTSDAFIALEALRATCIYKKGRQYAPVCSDLGTQEFDSPDQIKDFLNSHLMVEPLAGEGLLTGYYVPDYQADYVQTPEFSQPVRPKPDDLVTVAGSQLTPASSAAKIAARKVGDKYVPYYTRAEIEMMPVMTGYYMRPEDYFFMQIQGSGFLDMPDGKRVYAAYAADNGRPFVGVATVMVERGYLTKDQTSGDNIHQWLADHRGPEATEIMNMNPRYGFFAIKPEMTEPVGAAGLPLPPGSAIAVDPTQHDLGDLFWLDAKAGTLSGAFPAYQRLVAALDTGGAIKGNIRADLYIGLGARAGSEAGRIKHALHMWRIVPYAPG
ncbi:MAG: MltA domain-containing protein [Asticcacaulis sp.]|nr:MltA domain-containing protein [Asticcacaulis sp.]